jgi:FkbM family methyltransferase
MDKNLIYDIGFNNGDDTAYYLFRGYNVIGIDANPFLIAEGVRRFSKEIREGRLILLNYGMSNKVGVATLFINTLCDQWSSITGDMGKRNDVNAYPVKVACVDVPYLFALFGVPFYMKVDVEGGDADVISSMNPQSEVPMYISVESHEERCLDELLRLGYNTFKFINQQGIARQNYFNWEFSCNSSGRLAWEAEEPWITGDEIRSSYINRNMNDWFDFHATKI